MHELEHIVRKYRLNRDEAEIYFHRNDKSSRKSLTKVVKFIPHLVAHECPDIYAKLDSEILILEHFQFDSGDNLTYGGSLQKHEEVRVNKRFDKIVSESKDGSAIVHDTYKCNSSYLNYKNNFIKGFQSHYSRIPQYISNLRENGIIKEDDIYNIAFFIEDSSSLGSPYLTENNELAYLIPYMTDFLWELLEENNNVVNYLFFGLFDGENHIIYFIDINTDYDYNEEIVLDLESKFSPLGSNVTSFSIPIKE